MPPEQLSDPRVPISIADAEPARTEPAPPSRWYRRPLQIIGIAIGVVIALIGLEQLVFYNRVLPGVHVGGVDIDQKTKSAARDALADRAHRMETAPIVATVGGERVTTTPAAIGLTVDVDATLQAARDAGRKDLNPWQRITSPFSRMVSGDDISWRVRYDDAKVAAVLQDWEARNVTGFTAGDVTFNGTTVVKVEPVAGKTVDAEAARGPFEAALRAGTGRPVALPTKPVRPVLTEADVQRVADAASAVLSAPYTVTSGPVALTLTPAQIATALTTTRQPDGTGLALALDPLALYNTVGTAANGFIHPPVDARFVVNGDNTVSIVPSQDGLALDFNVLGPAILAGQRQIEAPLGPLHPAKDTAWAQALGIHEVVGTFTTNHPCCAARVTNIHLAADIIQNTVVEPGQVFSLNDTLGPRTAARGFLEAPVYYQGFTTDVGGGVSQISTTLFNAAWWGGLQIVEHKPHSIWITRYPPGREATLNYGTVDNKFKNNTQHGILVHTSYTGTSITVTMFGDKEGKSVREENRQVTSGTQAAGAPFVVEFDRVIDQPGQPEVREHYRWRYVQEPAH